jgi:hypothetical protein
VAQLQLDAQCQRGVSDLHRQYQRQETARAFIGLEQAHLRNKQTAAARSEADAALVQLGVVSPAPCLESELEVQLKCSCGFSSTDPAAVEAHLADCEPDRFACSKCGETGLYYEDGDKEMWWAQIHPDEVACEDCKGPEFCGP